MKVWRVIKARLATPTMRRLLRRPSHLTVREEIARRYLRGDGIEVGALNTPLRVPGCTVRYVDCAPADVVEQRHADVGHIPQPDIVAELETLNGIGDASVDFVIANHVLEHVENPLLALASIARVLKTGGVTFIALPDKRFTFDKRRAVTPLCHIVRDYEEGPQWSRTAHYLDYVIHVDRARDPPKLAAEYERIGQNIHFHVWDLDAMRSMFEYANWLSIEHVRQIRGEVIWILRKS